MTRYAALQPARRPDNTMRITEAGIELDSEFAIELLDGQPAITMSSHSGRSGGRPARNSQYSDALRVVLERLADLDARIIDALVVSSTSLRDYPDEADRRFGGPFPIRVRDYDASDLRTQLTEAMRSVARRAELGPGGNGRRRVTFLLSLQGDGSVADLAAYLAGVSNAVVGKEEGGRGAPTDAARVATASGPGAPLATDDVQQRRSRQQGYVADAAYRRAVELHAMRIAIEHYEGAWEVKDTSAGHPYDLVTRRGDRTRYIEVKGTTGTGDQVHLTANEVDHVRRTQVKSCSSWSTQSSWTALILRCLLRPGEQSGSSIRSTSKSANYGKQRTPGECRALWHRPSLVE